MRSWLRSLLQFRGPLATCLMSIVLLLLARSTECASLLFLGDKDYPPVAFLEDGVAKGMDVDLANALAGPLKREIRVELMDWAAILPRWTSLLRFVSNRRTALRNSEVNS